MVEGSAPHTSSLPGKGCSTLPLHTLLSSPLLSTVLLPGLPSPLPPQKDSQFQVSYWRVLPSHQQGALEIRLPSSPESLTPPSSGSFFSLRILPFNLSSPALSTSHPSGPFQELSSSPQGPSCPCQDSHLPGPFFSLQNLILGFLLASAGTFISLRFSSAFPGLSPPASPLQRSPLLSQSPSSPGAWLFETPAPAAPPV